VASSLWTPGKGQATGRGEPSGVGIPFSPPGAHRLWQYCASLYERVALIITTHVHLADWTQLCGDARLTAAVLDRLTSRAPSWNSSASRCAFASVGSATRRNPEAKGL